MSNAAPGQLPHYLVKSVIRQSLSGLVKLEGNPSIPAEYSAIKDVVDSCVDKIEELFSSVYPNNDMVPIGSMTVSAVGAITKRRGFLNGTTNPDIAFNIVLGGGGLFTITFTAGMPAISSAHAQCEGVGDGSTGVTISSTSVVVVGTFQGGVGVDNAFNIIFYQ